MRRGDRELELDAVEPRLVAGVLRQSCQLGLRTRTISWPGVQWSHHVGAGAEGMAHELRAPLLDPLLGHDGGERHGERVQEGGVGVREVDLHGVRVDHLEAGDLLGLAGR